LRKKRSLFLLFLGLFIILLFYHGNRVRKYTPPSFGGRIPSDLGIGLLRGVAHIHSFYSDGGGTIEDIAAAAKKCGLDFIITTDHDTLLPLREGKEGQYGPLTVLVGSEVSVGTGHYLVLDLPVTDARISGDPETVTRQIRRLGGFGIIAHPFKPGKTGWTDWNVKGFTGIEILNGSSMVKRGSLLAMMAAPFLYPLNSDYCFLKFSAYPGRNLKKWDSLCREGRISGTYGSDAHASVQLFEKHLLRLPSYESILRIASLNVLVRNRGKPLPLDFESRKKMIYHALKEGNTYISLDAMGRESGFVYYATASGKLYLAGETVPLAPRTVTLRAVLKAPPESMIRLIRGGETIKEINGNSLVYHPRETGVYRVEVYLPPGFSPGSDDCPWIISNPIYLRLATLEKREPKQKDAFVPALMLEDFESGQSLFRASSETESRAHSMVHPGHSGGEENKVCKFSFYLGDEKPKAHYTWCTFSYHKPLDYDRFKGVVFRAKSNKIIRLGVRLKEVSPDDAAITVWDDSVIVDESWRRYKVPFSRMSRYRLEEGVWEKAGGRSFKNAEALFFLIDNVINWGNTEAEIQLDDIALYD